MVKTIIDVPGHNNFHIIWTPKKIKRIYTINSFPWYDEIQRQKILWSVEYLFNKVSGAEMVEDIPEELMDLMLAEIMLKKV